VLEDGASLAIEGFDASLEQQMCPILGPLHWLALTKTFAHHLIDRGLDKVSRNCLAIAPPFPIIGMLYVVN
jgi:hypothetical protein